MRLFSIIVVIGGILGATCQVQAQQSNPASANRFLPARQFLFAPVTPQPADKLRSDMLRLVADSRAGRIAPHPQQMPAAKVNNLSKTAKIAIIAGVAVVVLTIVVVHGLNDLHCTSRCVL